MFLLENFLTITILCLILYLILRSFLTFYLCRNLVHLKSTLTSKFDQPVDSLPESLHTLVLGSSFRHMITNPPLGLCSLFISSEHPQKKFKFPNLIKTHLIYYGEKTVPKERVNKRQRHHYRVLGSFSKKNKLR
jgi:hypothetical protein